MLFKGAKSLYYVFIMVILFIFFILGDNVEGEDNCPVKGLTKSKIKPLYAGS